MRFIKVSDPDTGLKYLNAGLKDALDNYDRVTWIVSGGSNIALSVKAYQLIPKDQLIKLTVLLADERYGEPGHADSNYTQLENAGFNFNPVTSFQVLRHNESFENLISEYNQKIKLIFSSSQVIIGQFGIGADGHTAGILPYSPASKEHNQFVTGYNASDFSRITLTFEAIKMIDQAYVYAFGQNKLATLQELSEKDIDLTQQPAQVFRQFVQESFIVNDMIGEV